MNTNATSKIPVHPCLDASDANAVLAADYVLIGPRVDSRVVAQAFALVALATPNASHEPVDPERTVDIPTTHVKLFRRRDGVVLVWIDDELVAEAEPARACGKAQLRFRRALSAAA